MSEAAAEPGLTRLLSDERLTRRAAGGDQRAFAAIFRRYHQILYRFCLALVGNPDDAQEALQNTMTKVLRALPGEEREIELKPWLYRIAHNESIDLLRRRRETRQLDVEQIAPGYGLAEDAETRERLRRLVADLKELPERQREVLVMRELSGLDFEEIGTALATSGAVARQTLYEARQSLRQMDEGREMSCAEVTKALSDGDGRVTRRRDVRAHLRACSGCRAFGEEIKSRQRDFAALAPLPPVAAAGMLQGLLGGSQGAAGGGGLAATLGGGAAKTIGASVAAKGVATVAAVAAIGVTAADRTGAIHLGLPGEGDGRQAPATPAEAKPGSAAGVAATHGAGAAAGGGVGSGSGSAKAKTRSAAAAAPSQDALTAAAGHVQGEGSVNAQGWGPDVEHPSGKDHEQQPSPAASKGEETAAGHEPSTPAHEPSGAAGGDGKAAAPAKPPQAEVHPQPAPSEPPREPPSELPSAAPESEVQPPNPPVEHPTPEAHPGAGSESDKGKGGEKGKGAG
jgi:RNA polymerase sigma factor (sigma-70 family)